MKVKVVNKKQIRLYYDIVTEKHLIDHLINHFIKNRRPN